MQIKNLSLVVARCGPDPRRPVRGRLAGFTLVELIMTILIIGLIAGVGSSLFFNINVFRQSGFYDETISAVRYAQKYAVATGCAVQVQVSGNGYTLSQVPAAVYDPASSDACNTPPYSGVMSDPSQGGASFTRTAPTGVTLTASSPTFVFCPWGDTSATNSCVGTYNNVNVTLTVGTRTMTVYGTTGFVQAQ
jgi:MSHA pilin protein MshC